MEVGTGRVAEREKLIKSGLVRHAVWLYRVLKLIRYAQKCDQAVACMVMACEWVCWCGCGCASGTHGHCLRLWAAFQLSCVLAPLLLLLEAFARPVSATGCCGEAFRTTAACARVALTH